MRRRLIQAVVILGVIGLVAIIYLRLFTGGPVSYIGGGWLRGELVTEPVEDWSFIPEQQHYLDVESRAGWLPYSARPWFMVHEQQLYLLLPSLFGDALTRRIAEDPSLRVRVEGRIYPRRAVKVDEEGNLALLLAPFLRRQMAIEIGGKSRRVDSGLDAKVWVYRLDSP